MQSLLVAVVREAHRPQVVVQAVVQVVTLLVGLGQQIQSQ
jgi:hypothetical protein